jgi:TRAP-type transport system periplasmic protein
MVSFEEGGTMSRWNSTIISLIVPVVISMMPLVAYGGTPSFPKVDIKLGHAMATETSSHQGTLKFAELVKQRTGGAVNVQVFPAGQLGGDNDLLDQLKNSVIQMMALGGPALAGLRGWEPVGVFTLPFLFKGDNEEEQYAALVRLMRGPLGKEITDNARKASGVRALDASWWYGVRQTTTKAKQITKPDDFKGLKMRAPDQPIHKVSMATLGAAVTPMALSELYTALQMGVVDGQQNPLNTIYAYKFYEVQKYLTLLGDMMMSFNLITDDKFFQGLSPELRDILEKSALDAGDYQSRLQLNANKQNLDDLKAKGMIVNTVNRAEFAEKTKDAWKAFEPQFGKGLYEKVISALK